MVQPVLHVVGARPNFMKAAPVVRALQVRGVAQVVVHTGQHYDPAMSDVFFRQLGLPEPDVNLGVGSGSHAQQTAALLVGLEGAVLEHRPRLVVVYGDVNSTLAAALVAAKLHIPAAHVEAGLRSFDMAMPEEVNRRVTDALCDLLLVTSPEALVNLGAEGIEATRTALVGNPMIDSLLQNLERFDDADAAAQLGLPDMYGVATLHRPSNVDDPQQAQMLVDALHDVGEMVPLVLPVHPRGKLRLEAAGLGTRKSLRAVDPLGYVEFLSLVKSAALVITDSGGVQEETTVLGVPCLTLRSTTERPVTVTSGTNRLVGVGDLADEVQEVLASGRAPLREPPPLWDGRAGDRIGDRIVAFLES